jgi:FKBP-type peptidyl-prolyl cis-trans isomerase 2
MNRAVVLAASLVFAVSTHAFGEEGAIADGSKVKFDYTLYVNGQVADSSQGKEPLEYTQGAGMIIPGLEVQMAGLKEGDVKTISVESEDAYGQVNPEAIVEIPKENLGEEIDPKVGMILQMQTQDGQALNGIITEIKDTTLVMNFNHPLAGQDLTFDVKIVDVQ